MDYNRPTPNSFEKCSKMFLRSLLTVCLSLLPFFMKREQFKRQQMAKMNDRVPKERLGTSRLGNVFLKICPYDPT